MQDITMTSNNNGSHSLGEDNTNLSQDPPQAITITIMEPSSALEETLDKASLNTSNLNRNISSIVSSGPNAGTFLVMPSRGTVNDVGSATVITEKEHVLQTSISKTQLEEELPVISNISNPEELLNEGQEITEEGEVYDGEDVDITASSGPHCLVCNKELPQTTQHDTPVAIFQVQTTTTQRKMSVLLGGLVGQKITSRKSHSDLVCSRCYNLLDKVDSLEVELQDTKNDIVNTYQTTLAVYGGRARRRKPATSKKSDFVFPKLEPDEPEREEVSLEFDSNFEPRDEDLLEEEADHQEDLIASGALDDEWEPEFKRSRLKRENTDTDPGVAPKRRRGRPRKDVTKPKECLDELLMDEAAALSDAPPSTLHNSRVGAQKMESCTYCGEEVPVLKLLSHLHGHEQRHHQCPFCSFTASRLALSHHLQQHHREKIFSCDVCQLKFYDNVSFDRHKEGHVSGKHLCKLCELNFSTVNELNNHINVSHTLKTASKFTCSACHKDFSYWSSLVGHVVRNHKGQVDVEGLTWGPRGSLVCSLCSQKFKKISKFIAHERMHTNEKLYCQHCKLNFPCESSLLNHLEIEKSIDQIKFECQICQLDFTSSEELKDHNKIHSQKANETEEENQIYECQTCDRVLRNKVQLICHRRKEHPESEEAISAKFSCPQCGMKFVGKGNLIKHIKMHQKLKLGNSRVCDICGKILSNKYTLATHMKTHTSDVSFKCTICNKSFFSKYTLVHHIQRIHDDSDAGRDKVCHECGRTFFTNSELKYHLKSHTGERPYHCQICGETYLSSSTLRYHIQKHSSVMFVCPSCNARFKNYIGWSAHMRRVHGIASVKDYTKQHGILQAVTEKEPFVMVSRNLKSITSEEKEISNNSKDFSRVTSRGDLCIGFNETVVDLPCDQEDENNVIHVVSYDDLSDPHLAVHTVEAPLSPTVVPESASHEGYQITEVSAMNLGGVDNSTECSTHPYTVSTAQSTESSHVMIPEGWDVILPAGSEIISGENWDRTRVEGSSGTGNDAQMVLGGDWEN